NPSRQPVNGQADEFSACDRKSRSERKPPPDPFGAYGEPFASYLDLLGAIDEADRRLWAARVAGDVNAIFAAEFDLDVARCALHDFKYHAAKTLLLFARFAAEVCPGALQAFLDPVFRGELEHTQYA